MPAKLQVNLESDGIIFELEHANGGIALIFLDPLDQIISFIEPGKQGRLIFILHLLAYVLYVKKLFTPVKRTTAPTAVNDDHPATANVTNKWLDRSFSLSDWTNENSIDQDTLKKNNKLVKTFKILSFYFMQII